MKVGQAEKFISKRVYVVMDDTSIFYGLLNAVQGVVATIIDPDTEKQVRTHIKFVFPDRNR